LSLHSASHLCLCAGHSLQLRVILLLCLPCLGIGKCVKVLAALRSFEAPQLSLFAIFWLTIDIADATAASYSTRGNNRTFC
jgi:hypothetical protein